jgi:DDE domain
VTQTRTFKGRQFSAEVILWALRWYCMFPVSYRDLELMLADRGVTADHTTIFRCVQAYAEDLEKRLRPHLRSSNGSWRVDETDIKGKGGWTYLYRAVDSRGQTIASCSRRSGMPQRRSGSSGKRWRSHTRGTRAPLRSTRTRPIPQPWRR